MIIPRFLFFRFVFDNLKDLPVCDISPSYYAQHDKNSNKNSLCAKPFVKVPSDKEAEEYASRHGKAHLHDDLRVFSPVPVPVVVEEFLSRLLISFQAEIMGKEMEQ